MESRVISMIGHPNYKKPRLFLPYKPACRVYSFSTTKQHQHQQRKMTVEEEVNELWERLIDLEFEIMRLLEQAREGGR